MWGTGHTKSRRSQCSGPMASEQSQRFAFPNTLMKGSESRPLVTDEETDAQRVQQLAQGDTDISRGASLQMCVRKDYADHLEELRGARCSIPRGHRSFIWTTFLKSSTSSFITNN